VTHRLGTERGEQRAETLAFLHVAITATYSSRIRPVNEKTWSPAPEAQPTQATRPAAGWERTFTPSSKNTTAGPWPRRAGPSRRGVIQRWVGRGAREPRPRPHGPV